MMPPGTTLRNIRISDELYNAVQAKCIQQQTTFSEVVRELLVNWLEERKK